MHAQILTMYEQPGPHKPEMAGGNGEWKWEWECLYVQYVYFTAYVNKAKH